MRVYICVQYLFESASTCVFLYLFVCICIYPYMHVLYFVCITLYSNIFVFIYLCIFVRIGTYYLPPAHQAGDYKTHYVRVCVTFLKRPVHHTGCFSLAFSMFYDLIAYVFSFNAVFSELGP